MLYSCFQIKHPAKTGKQKSRSYSFNWKENAEKFIFIFHTSQVYVSNWPLYYFCIFKCLTIWTSKKVQYGYRPESFDKTPFKDPLKGTLRTVSLSQESRDNLNCIKKKTKIPDSSRSKLICLIFLQKKNTWKLTSFKYKVAF